MKYIKKYEKNVDEIKVGDYVLIEYGRYVGFNLSEIHIFFRNTIGKVRSLYGENVCVEYGYSIPKKLEIYFSKEVTTGRGLWMKFFKVNDIKNIIFSSPNKADVEAYLDLKKYNL